MIPLRGEASSRPLLHETGPGCRRHSHRPWRAVSLLLAASSGLRLAAGEVAEPEASQFGFKASTRWRIVHLDPVTYGWAIGGLRLFSDTSCEAEIKLAAYGGQAVAEASGHLGLAAPEHAFDDHTWTEWRAQCYICEPGEAWIGISLPEAENVHCIQIWQVGRNEYSTSKIALQRWDALELRWDTILRGSELVGSRWDKIGFVRCAELQVPAHGSVNITNNGIYPSSAMYYCRGARIMSGFRALTCQSDGEWNDVGGSGRRCWTPMEIIVMVMSFFLFQLVAFAVYYWLEIVPRDELAKPINHDSVFMESGLRHWNNDILVDATQSAQRQLRCCLLCPCCRLADTWRGMSLVSYHWGVLIPQVFCLCLPCIGAFLRRRIRERFHIFSSVQSSDLIWWCFCGVFAATQEAKHIDEMRIVSRHTMEQKVREAAERSERIENIRDGKVMQKEKVGGPVGKVTKGGRQSMNAASLYGKPGQQQKMGSMVGKPGAAAGGKFKRISVLEMEEDTLT